MNDIHALSGAYAVDALDDLERAEFERHLAECDACRDEVDSLREAGALLVETVPSTPPSSLRDRVLADIATVRPLPPVVVDDLARVRERRSRRWFPGVVAAAAVVTALGVGAAVVQPWQDEDRGNDQVAAQPRYQSAAERVRSAPDAQSWTHTFENGAKATLIRSESLNQAVIVTRDMQPAPEGKVYELWLQQDGDMVPAGLMPEGPDTVMALEGSPATASGFGITVEQSGGSPTKQPTSEPIAFTKFNT